VLHHRDRMMLSAMSLVASTSSAKFRSINEQWHSASAFANDCDDLFRQHRTAGCPRHLNRLTPAQAVERQRRDMRVTGPIRPKLWAVRDQDQDPRAGHACEQTLDQIA